MVGRQERSVCTGEQRLNRVPRVGEQLTFKPAYNSSSPLQMVDRNTVGYACELSIIV
jgi:hypothetical protein